MNRWTFPRYFFPSQYEWNVLKVSPARGLQVGGPHRFRSRGTTRSSLLDQDSGHLCGGRRIHLSGHSDWNVYQISGRFPFLLACKLTLRRLLVRHNLVALLLHPLLIRDADEPCSVMSLNRLSQRHLGPRPRLCLLTLWFQIGILEMTDVHKRSKMESSLLFLCFQNDHRFAVHFGHLPHRQLFDLRPFLVHCSYYIRNFHYLVHKNKLVHKIIMTQPVEPHLRNVIFVIFW